MIDNKHPAVSPPKSNLTLWRYTDLTKFLSLLETKKLFFTRADEFEDPYEGRWSNASLQSLSGLPADFPIPKEVLAKGMLDGIEKHRMQMFISCWFASEHESAAMWKLYLQSPEGVAIKTNHDALVRCLDKSPLKARTTMVKYIDYESTVMPTENIFFPFVHKRLSFSHENELRALIWSFEDVNKKQIPEDAQSLSIDIDLDDLVQSVHVAPTAPIWFGELVEQLMVRYGLSIPVVHSNLYARPIY